MIELDSRIIELRHRLHTHAELSHYEVVTRTLLIDFLKQNTSLEIFDKGEYFYALHQEEGKRIAFRADMDAISGAIGTYHGCGHDGHCASLAALGLWLEGRTVGKRVYLLFQSAEEVGEGANLCMDFLKQEQIDEIYGYHNIPNFPLGAILVKQGVFACASRGVSIHIQGRQTHAATPELGENPGFAIARLINNLPMITNQAMYQQMVQCSLVHIRVGEKAFGVSAGEGEICFTIRSHLSDDLNLLQERIIESIKKEAKGMCVTYEIHEPFVDTSNHQEELDKAIQAFTKANLSFQQLDEPFRWSEDFGVFLKHTKGCFFGIGAGEEWPALHTPEYEFNDAILDVALQLYIALVKE